jgi:hypothetical protein
MLLAKAYEVILDALPDEVLIDPEKAQLALKKFRLRPDNNDVSACIEMITELDNCIVHKLPDEIDIEELLAHLEKQLKLQFGK